MVRRPIASASLSLLVAVSATPLRAQVDPDLLAGLKARSIGPAGMSGRVITIKGVPSNRDILYVGSATGGVWKSVDAGLTWTPIFDDQPVASIGSIAIYGPNPDVVWVGTGERNPRNSVSVGNGVYRSIDGGRTWTHLGLDRTERIGKVQLDPRNPNVAYVAALGTAWGENPERGVFKTTDGGKTWTKILYVDEKTGAVDLAMDPSNPDKMLAAMWQYRRWPWSFKSGGPGSGLYLTVDGGATWKRLSAKDGLPAGDLGRIGLAFAPSDPSVAYAIVEAKKNVFLRSADGGYTWKTVNTGGENMGNRPFYFSEIRVDPQDPNRIYSLWSRLSVSDDGGRTFETLGSFQSTHPDHHAMWIDPNDARYVVEGNDGGVYISRDRGDTWRSVANLPLAQFYHITVDTLTPYHVYGGLQDNGSWRGPAEVWVTGGIRNMYWDEIGFGDGFGAAPIPGDPTTGYSMSQEGFLMRWDVKTGQRKDIRPAPPSDSVRLRFNWNAAIAVDPFDGNTVYFGSQFVHKSTDRGESWTIISPDLTTNNPDWQKQGEAGGLTPDVTGAENFTTIITIAPSPVQQGVIWVGTDDGRVQVTRDGGATWTSVEKNLKGVPANTWVPHIEASKYDAATAYIVLDNHRRSDWTPYVYRTTDYGDSWRSLATADLRGYALTIEQDPVKRDLLFLGTEFGLYVSLDAGARWMKWTHGLPTVGVREMATQPQENDLVIATHGRGVYVIDDITPLRTVTAEVLKEPLHLFPIADAQQHEIAQAAGSRFPGDGEYRGENEPYGALITFSLNAEGLPKAGEPANGESMGGGSVGGGAADSAGGGKKPPQVTIQIVDGAGDTIRTMKVTAKLGVNRAVWNLSRDAFRRPGGGGGGGFFGGTAPEVPAGAYTVRVAYEDHQATGPVRVRPDPRYDIPDDARRAKYTAELQAGALQEVVADAVDRIGKTRKDIDAVVEKAKADTAGAAAGGKPHGDLVEAARALKKKLGAAERRFWTPPDTKGIVEEENAYSKVRYAYRALSSSWDAPTAAQRAYLAGARSALQAAVAELNRLYSEDVAAFRSQVQAAGIGLLGPTEPLKMPGG